MNEFEKHNYIKPTHTDKLRKLELFRKWSSEKDAGPDDDVEQWYEDDEKSGELEEDEDGEMKE